MDVFVSGTIDQKTYLKNLGGGFSPLSPPLGSAYGAMRRRFAMNPTFHRTILRKSITFAYVHLRGDKSELRLEEA